jgi:hypothetical protein
MCEQPMLSPDIDAGERSVQDCRRSTLGMITSQEFESLLPLLVEWAAERERVVLQTGFALTEPQLADARQVGVVHPDRVRLVRAAEISMPDHPALLRAGAASGLIAPNTLGMSVVKMLGGLDSRRFFSPGTAALTLRYGILVRADCWEHRRLIVHELVHTSQYERLGGLEAFLRPYLLECITPPGYPFGPMEQEAITVSAKVCP